MPQDKGPIRMIFFKLSFQQKGALWIFAEHTKQTYNFLFHRPVFQIAILFKRNILLLRLQFIRLEQIEAILLKPIHRNTIRLFHVHIIRHFKLTKSVHKYVNVYLSGQLLINRVSVARDAQVRPTIQMVMCLFSSFETKATASTSLASMADNRSPSSTHDK